VASEITDVGVYRQKLRNLKGIYPRSWKHIRID